MSDRAPLLSDLFDESRLGDGATGDIGAVDAHRVALSDSAEQLTWSEAVDRVRRIAALLQHAGVAAGDRVGVWMPKSVDSFVAVHAILRCGAVMVPLDPMSPAPQIRSLLEDAGIEVLVADTRARHFADVVGGSIVSAVVLPRSVGAEAPASGHGVDVLCGDLVEPLERDGRLVAVDPEDPAYIIYTSGSTGRPKGIVHTHASGLAYARAAVRQYGLRSDDHFANVAPLHFDQSTFELYAAPLVGASVLTVPDAVVRFPASLSELVARERVTIWYSVPYVLEQLSSRGGLAQRDLTALRWVLFGGESFPPAQLTALMERLPHATFSNVYGPAEVNQCTVYDLEGPPSGAVPIGRAWEEAELRLVDPDDHTVEVTDRPGVLLVSTRTMMSHYWNRADLTERSILVHDGRRWYRTGDLVEWSSADPDLLVFLGRVDNQVKLRGHRIELEAIDAMLRGVEGVVEATTVVRRDPNGDDVLAALVAAPDAVADPVALSASVRQDLEARLPRYAVPAEIRVVATLPRTGTGKVDRGASASLLVEEPHDAGLNGPANERHSETTRRAPP